MTTAERAKLVQCLVTISECVAQMIDILMPGEDIECEHPEDQVTYKPDDDEGLWTCTKCGTVQDKPFHGE
jgi:hypothetical protein